MLQNYVKIAIRRVLGASVSRITGLLSALAAMANPVNSLRNE